MSALLITAPAMKPTGVSPRPLSLKIRLNQAANPLIRRLFPGMAVSAAEATISWFLSAPPLT